MRRAAFRLGLLYQDGRGIGRDHKLAVHWYRDAAEAGLPEAQFNLGYLYERGLGLRADGVQAAQAAKQSLEAGQSSFSQIGGTSSTAADRGISVDLKV